MLEHLGFPNAPNEASRVDPIIHAHARLERPEPRAIERRRMPSPPQKVAVGGRERPERPLESVEDRADQSRPEFRGERPATGIDLFSYTHLTLPTIYSV